jgi:hypothetical protein
MTLYFGYAPKETFFLLTTTVGKVEDIRQISKPLELTAKPTNKNLYAIVGDDQRILCLGMVKKETIRSESVYVGQKVYAFDKKTLCDYYRYKVRDFCNQQENIIAQSERLLRNGGRSDGSFYEGQIHRCGNKIKDAQRQYKTLIETIKQL